MAHWMSRAAAPNSGLDHDVPRVLAATPDVAAQTQSSPHVDIGVGRSRHALPRRGVDIAFLAVIRRRYENLHNVTACVSKTGECWYERNFGHWL